MHHFKMMLQTLYWHVVSSNRQRKG